MPPANPSQAFATLVARYVDLVYSRHCGRRVIHILAGEITQAVLIILARKAGSLWRAPCSCPVALPRRRSFRRRRRSQESTPPRATRTGSPHAIRNSIRRDRPGVKIISPLLDQALIQLGETDRRAVVLHFFQKKTFAGSRLLAGLERGLGPEDARAAPWKNCGKIFSTQGVHSTTRILAGAISTCSCRPPRRRWRNAVSAAALVKGATASGLDL